MSNKKTRVKGEEDSAAGGKYINLIISLTLTILFVIFYSIPPAKPGFHGLRDEGEGHGA